MYRDKDLLKYESHTVSTNQSDGLTQKKQTKTKKPKNKSI